MKSVVFSTLLLIGCNLFAQTTPSIPSVVRVSETMRELSNGLSGSDLIYGVPIPEAGVVGDEYYKKDWFNSDILTYQGSKRFELKRARFNIKTSQLEYESEKGEVKGLDGSKIQAFTLETHVDSLFFVNGKEYRLDGVPLVGFLEVMVPGNKSLFKHTSIVIKKPNYRVEFDMGSRDYEIVKKVAYYTTNGQDLLELNVKNEKKFVKTFGEKGIQVQELIDVMKIDKLSNEFQLVSLFQTINAKQL